MPSFDKIGTVCVVCIGGIVRSISTIAKISHCKNLLGSWLGATEFAP